MDSINKEKIYALSENQKGLLFLFQMEETRSAYNLPAALLIRGKLDIDKLEEAITVIIDRHDSLRTSFRIDPIEPVQIVHEKVNFRVKKLDITACSEREKAEKMKTISIEAKKPFNLETPPLLRVTVVKMEEEKNLLLITMHHIVSDGWSLEVFQNELMTIYGLYVSQGNIALEIPVQFGQVLSWHENWMESATSLKQLEYWLNKLSGIEPLDLPTDFPRNKQRSYQGKRIKFTYDPELLDGLKKLARKEKSTLFITLLAAFYVLLYKFSGETDLVITSPFAGRLQEEWERIIGFLANNMPLRAIINPKMTFAAFLSEVKQNTFEAYKNQPFPYSKIIRALSAGRNSSGPLVSEISFGFDLISADSMRDFAGLQIEGYEIEEFDIPGELLMFVIESDQGIIGYVDFSIDLFREETINQLIICYENILKSITVSSQQQIQEIEMLSNSEKEKILHEFNAPYLPVEKPQTYVEIFEEQVRRYPDRVGIIFQDQRLTYQEINDRANYIADVLRRKGVAPGMIVGVMTKRSPEMLVGIVGVLKAGAAYLPIDLKQPAERVRYMLADSEARVVITTENLCLPEFTGEAVLLKQADNEKADPVNPDILCNANDVMYVIYTSGSTGRPKGVMISHRSAQNFLKGITEKIDFSPEKTIISVTTMSFDIFLLETLLPLSQGMKVVIADEDQPKKTDELINLLIAEEVDIMQTTPSGMQLLLTDSDAGLGLKGLKEILIGGESFPPPLLKKLKQLTKAKIYNMYGPTETTVWSTYRELTDLDYVDIGKPILNTKVLILDGNNKLQPSGFPGEICISGEGLAVGYLKRPELTREKFIPNLYGEGLLYKTGDLGRWKPDGNLECLGRIDEQVKVRGFRIELGEIESRLLSYPTVEKAAVKVGERRDKSLYLAAYYVSHHELSGSDLRVYLSKELPEYMIPAYFMRVMEMPLSPNGKTDKRALPEPDETNITQREYIPPRNEREKLVVQIFQDVLGMSQIGIKDNFFELGGDSIKAIQFLAKLQQAGLRLELAELFAFPTASELNSRIKVGISKPFQGIVEGVTPLNPAQASFLEGQSFNTQQVYWYNTLIIHNTKGWKPEIVEETIMRIFKHHDGLRSILTDQAQELKLEIKGLEVLRGLNILIRKEVQSIDLMNLFQQEVTKLISMIDHKSAPLLQTGLVQTELGDYLIIPIHRLIADEYSLKIMAEDLLSVYEEIISGKEGWLPAKTHSLKEWANVITDYLRSNELSKEIAYWVQNSRDQSGEGRSVSFSNFKQRRMILPKEETKDLLSTVHWAYNTKPLDLIVTAVVSTIRELEKKGQVHLFLEDHEKRDLLPEINLLRTVGKIGCGFPVLFALTNEDNLADQIKYVKEYLRSVPHQGIGYSTLKYLSPDENLKDKVNCILPDLYLNYVGASAESVNAEGINVSVLRSDTGRHRQFPLELRIIEKKDCMEWELIYAAHYDERRIDYLASGFLENLRKLIAHCLSRTEQELTPSDYGYSQLTLEELEMIQNHVETLEAS